MQLNHFADAFQNGHASVDQFFSESNHLTEQYASGYSDTNNGYGFAQNASGYEWGDGNVSSGSHYHSHDPVYDAGAAAHSHEFRGNGGYHSTPPGTCGADPQSLARMNLEWENHMTHENGMGSGQHLPGQPAYPHQGKEEEKAPEYVYQGPDDLDFDDEEIAPKKGMGYWKTRAPTVIIHGLTVALWLWLWSSFGFSKLLPGTPGTLLYWGFIAVMVWGVFQSDHRAARYDEEREVLTGVESKLKMLVKLVGAAVTLLLSFKLLKGKSQGVQYGTHSALAIAFFVALFGLVDFSAKKRGETTRRYRKVKGAALNLSLGMLGVASLLLLGLGNGAATIQTGGGANPAASKKTTTEVLPEKIQIQPVKLKTVYQQETVPAAYGGGGGYDQYNGGGVDPSLANLAPAAMSGGGGGSPTIVESSYGGGGQAPMVMSPTVLQ